MKWQVSLNNDSFDRAGITKDCQDAICEYIWNGFEAGASKVCVSSQGAPLKEAPALSVEDNGSGISYDSLTDTFGAFCHLSKTTLPYGLNLKLIREKVASLIYPFHIQRNGIRHIVLAIN